MNKGTRLAFLTAGISGFSIFASKFFVAQIDPILFTTLKNLLVALVLSLLVGTTLRSEIRKLSQKDWQRLMGIGIIGGGVPFALFFVGLSKITALEGALIHKTLFLWVALLAGVFLHERLKKIQFLGYGLVTFGAVAMGLQSFGRWEMGHFMVLSATLMWSVEFILAKKTLKTVHPVLVAWSRMFFGAFILLAITSYQGTWGSIEAFQSTEILAILSGAVFLFGYVYTWYHALAHSPASNVSLVLSVSPVITGVLSAVFITHVWPTQSLVSFACIIVGVVISMAYGSFKKIHSV